MAGAGQDEEKEGEVALNWIECARWRHDRRVRAAVKTRNLVLAIAIVCVACKEQGARVAPHEPTLEELERELVILEMEALPTPTPTPTPTLQRDLFDRYNDPAREAAAQRLKRRYELVTRIRVLRAKLGMPPREAQPDAGNGVVPPSDAPEPEGLSTY